MKKKKKKEKKQTNVALNLDKSLKVIQIRILHFSKQIIVCQGPFYKYDHGFEGAELTARHRY